MRKSLKHGLILFVAAALITASFGSAAFANNIEEEPLSAEKMIADTLLVRPAAIVSTIFGTAVFVVSLPFSLLGGNTKASYQKLVVEPAKFAFTRPLGDF